MPKQPDQVVQTFSIGQCFFKGQHLLAILNLADLLGKDFGVNGIKAKQDVFDFFDFRVQFLLWI